MAFTNLSDLVACVSSSAVPPSSTSPPPRMRGPRADAVMLDDSMYMVGRDVVEFHPPPPVRATPQTIPGVGAVPVREDGIRIVGVYNSDRLVGKDGRVTSMRQDWLLSGGLDQSGAKRFSTSALAAAKAEPKVGTCRRCGLPSCMHPRAG